MSTCEKSPTFFFLKCSNRYQQLATSAKRLTQQDVCEMFRENRGNPSKFPSPHTRHANTTRIQRQFNVNLPVICDWRSLLWSTGLLAGEAADGVDSAGDGKVDLEVSNEDDQWKRPSNGRSRPKSKFHRREAASICSCNSAATCSAVCRASSAERGPNRQRLTRDRPATSADRDADDG